MTDELSFEAILKELQALVARLERAEALPLEEALELYERGVALAKLGGLRLEGAERRLEELNRSTGRAEPDHS